MPKNQHSEEQIISALKQYEVDLTLDRQILQEVVSKKL